MQLNPSTVDPRRLLKPMTVARKFNVHPSMVTHWMQGGTLDYVIIDGTKFVPEESAAVLESMRANREDARTAKQQVEQFEVELRS